MLLSELEQKTKGKIAELDNVLICQRNLSTQTDSDFGVKHRNLLYNNAS